MAPETKIYLGDGAYAEFTGFSVVLSAPRGTGQDEVHLEPQMLLQLIDFAVANGLIVRREDR